MSAYNTEGADETCDDMADVLGLPREAAWHDSKQAIHTPMHVQTLVAHHTQYAHMMRTAQRAACTHAYIGGAEDESELPADDRCGSLA